MFAKRLCLSIGLLLVFSRFSFAAVVPDADSLPRDSGAPALPGGRHDPARIHKDKSPEPVPAASAKPNPGTSASNGTSGKASDPRGSGGTGGSAPGAPADGGKDKDGEPSSGLTSVETPPPSVFILGVVLLLFVGWAGWKSRQSDRDD